MKKDPFKTPESLKEELKEKPVISIKILKRSTVNKGQKAPKELRSK